MIHEDYVSFEQAQKLKELGFDWECIGVYDSERPLGLIALDTQAKSPTNWNGNTDFDEIFSAPTLAQAAKWLREKKGIDITPIPVTRDDERKYRWALDRLNPRLQDWTDDIINNYEQALSAGIDKALEILKQK